MIIDTGSTGIKFREESFELKQKCSDLGNLETAPDISGNAERWKKWSFESRDNTIPFGEKTKGEWIEVAKVRNLYLTKKEKSPLVLITAGRTDVE